MNLRNVFSLPSQFQNPAELPRIKTTRTSRTPDIPHPLMEPEVVSSLSTKPAGTFVNTSSKLGKFECQYVQAMYLIHLSVVQNYNPFF